MKTKISIVGGGAAAMMLACNLDERKFDVTIYEKNKTLGRKFLVAGDGGLNLTHSEDISEMIQRYSPSAFLTNSFSSFTNDDLRNWLKGIGIATFVGTSYRVFPVAGIKPIEVLNSIINKLNEKNVLIKTQHRWDGWDNEGQLCFTNKNQRITVKSAITILALGGASWKVTGSDGAWINHLKEKGVTIIPFQSSNCSLKINWTDQFVQDSEGKSLKNIVISCGDKQQKGEVGITRKGIEGGAIYAINSAVRKQLNKQGKAIIFVDLKPTLTFEKIKSKLDTRGNKSITKILESELNLNQLQISMLKSIISKEEFTSPKLLSEKIKKLPLVVNGLAEIDEAISTVGGIPLHEIDNNFQLKKIPNNYSIGEMLDWDAPTGGYLLQASFSMGFNLANYLNEKY